MNQLLANAFVDELEKIGSASTWGKRTSRKVRKYLADVSGKRESDAAKKTYETFYRESKAKGGPGYERAARRHKAAVRLQRMAKASKIKARKQTALGAAGLTAGVGASLYAGNRPLKKKRNFLSTIDTSLLTARARAELKKRGVKKPDHIDLAEIDLDEKEIWLTKNKPKTAAANELEKLATSPKISRAGRKRKIRRTAQALAVGGAGSIGGYYLGKKGIPAIMKALGKNAKIPKKANKAAALLAGLSSAALYGYGKGWIDAPPPRRRSVLHKDRDVLPKDGKLSKRHKGHSPEVLPKVLLRDAKGSKSVPLRAGKRKPGLLDSGDGDGANNYRRGVDKYRYSGKKARDYNFKRSVRVREH